MKMELRGAGTAKSRWRFAAAIAAVGAGGLVAGYLLHPEFGRDRRLRLAGRVRHAVRGTAKRLERRARYVRESAYRQAQHRLHPLPPKPAEGRWLLDRVESELFANPAIPHGKLSFEVEDTTVVLRGQLDSQATITTVEEAVRAIPGVSGVRSLLHLAGTPAPNKVAALRASEVAVAEGWPVEAPPDVDSEA